MKERLKSVLLIILICVCVFFVIDYKYEHNKNEQLEQIEDEVEEVTYINVWTIANVDIKNKPDISSATIGSYNWNTGITVTYVDDNWAKVNDMEHYIDRNYLSESPIGYVDCDVPKNNTIKSYMDYRTITSKSSNQYKLQDSSAYTGDCGIRMVNGRYCIVVGSYYTTTIGQYIDVELENGSVIQGILADCKDNKHTDETNRINPNGSVLEFVVDTKTLDNTAKKMGDISYVNGWNSKIVNIKVYDKVEEF